MMYQIHGISSTPTISDHPLTFIREFSASARDVAEEERKALEVARHILWVLQEKEIVIPNVALFVRALRKYSCYPI